MNNKKNTCNNNSVFYGNSTKLIYDEDYYNDKIRQSTAVGNYNLDTNYVNNCQRCLSTLGPRTKQGPLSAGVSDVKPYSVPNFGNNVDIESILTNRNMPASKSSNGKLNPINVTNFRTYNLPTCGHFLDPVSTHLTNPPLNYKGISTNRFYDLNRNPQANIFWDFSVNTQLEIKDNFYEKMPVPLDEQMVFKTTTQRVPLPNVIGNMNCQ
ncbi:hypothetical protein Hokovirus_2_114 [Hokovirus HKV1]|uniref:Uncharacterized protein n=1 Tax=Hokovirus HKV1 TaxID=1977638 RepID=A0A1V0SFU5_9VIRU|nr:hypothetical protein Hokovirus_2_114 [Hokovirus HKV1]